MVIRYSRPVPSDSLVTYLAFKTYGYRGKELADALGYRSTTSIAVAAKRVEASPALVRAWRRLAREVRAIEKEGG